MLHLATYISSNTLQKVSHIICISCGVALPMYTYITASSEMRGRQLYFPGKEGWFHRQGWNNQRDKIQNADS